jgi:hypothetical protein
LAQKEETDDVRPSFPYYTLSIGFRNSSASLTGCVILGERELNAMLAARHHEPGKIMCKHPKKCHHSKGRRRWY